MLYAIAYDIADDKRRVRLAKMLEDFGDRVQYSLFEAVLHKSDELAELERRIWAVIDPEEDSVRIYALCRQCEGALRHFGISTPTRIDDAYIL